MDVALAFTLSSLLFIFKNVTGESEDNQSVKAQLKAVQSYAGKVKQVEQQIGGGDRETSEISTTQRKKRTLVINQAAANRIVKRAR